MALRNDSAAEVMDSVVKLLQLVIMFLIKSLSNRFSLMKCLSFGVFFSVLFIAAASCQRHGSVSGNVRNVAMVMALDEGDTPLSALLWIRDHNGAYQTYLMNGNKSRTIALASVPHLLTAWDSGVFQIDAETDEVMLCDCQKWQDDGADGECAAGLHSATQQNLLLTQVSSVVPDDSGDDGDTVDTENGERFPIDLFPFDIESEEMSRLVSLTQSAVVTGTIGPYIFVRYEREYQLCGDEQVNQSHGYRVFNVDKMAFEPLLSDEEMEKVRDVEQKTAYDTLGNAAGFAHVTVDDLTLSEIRPQYVRGLGFSLEYEFEARSQISEKENNWRDYTRQIAVQAQEIPDKLVPFALAPSVVRNIIPSENVTVGGWVVIDGMSESNRVAIEKLFDNGEQQSPETTMSDALTLNTLAGSTEP